MASTVRNRLLVNSPVGWLELSSEVQKGQDALTAVTFIEKPEELPSAPPGAFLHEAGIQLEEYFAGSRKAFELPLKPAGTAFQQSVWQALQHLAYGETLSYEGLSKRMEQPDAIRAIAAANGANPIAIIIPCHCIIGKDGSLTGYAGGLGRKEWLLRHEGALPARLF